MSAVEFGDGREPYVVYRRPKVKRWLHCIVRNIADLPVPQRDELAVWLAERGAEADVPSLVVTCDADGADLRVHVRGVAFDVTRADLLAWLREPVPDPPAQPKPKPAKAAKARPS